MMRWTSIDWVFIGAWVVILGGLAWFWIAVLGKLVGR